MLNLMERILVVGGGIVGLATALKLQELKKTKVTVFEKEKGICLHQSGRNSGVIHSGVYYKPGSKKALNCVEGYKNMIEFCDKYQIPYDLCGKLIVGNSLADLTSLKKLKLNGEKNGLTGLKILESEEIKKIEKLSTSRYALHVPQTGIINYKMVGDKIKELIEEQDGCVIFNTEVLNIIQKNDIIEVFIKNRIFSST